MHNLSFFSVLTWVRCIHTWFVLNLPSFQALHPYFSQQELKVCFWKEPICPRRPNLTPVCVYSISQSWHHWESFNWESTINMFTSLFLVNKHRGPSWLQSKTTQSLPDTKDNAALWTVSWSENMKMPHQMDEAWKYPSWSFRQPSNHRRGLLACCTNRSGAIWCGRNS